MDIWVGKAKADLAPLNNMLATSVQTAQPCGITSLFKRNFFLLFAIGCSEGLLVKTINPLRRSLLNNIIDCLC